ncbi:MAG: DUF433 domain-containing protein [Planctomycetes bacterium]|nr:DUF433 domain-containing protein [Planctomycetota bacterium]
MRMAEFLDRRGPDELLVRGTRLPVECVVYSFQGGLAPEEIVSRYPTLSLDQAYGVIAYYLASRPRMDAYIARVERDRTRSRRVRAMLSLPLIQRLRQARACSRQHPVEGR